MATTQPRRATGRPLDRFGWSALRYRPFQLFLVAMLSGNIGGFVYVAALGWFVLGVTGSAAAVGVAYALNGLPQLLLTLHAGAFTDRFGARAMLALGIGSAGIAMFIAGVLAALPQPPLELIMVAALASGVGYAIGGPGSLSIVSELVPQEAMSSSVALNWLQQSVARILGGLLGGTVLALASPAAAFALAGIMNAAPSLIVLALRLRVGAAERVPAASSLLRPVIEGIAYARRHLTLGVIVLLAAAPGTIGLPYIFLLPAAAKQLGIGADGLGNLIAVAGLGGLVAGAGLENLQRRWGHGRAVFLGLGVSSAALMLIGLAPSAAAAYVLLAFVGAGFAMYGAATGTLIQAISPPRLRGRMVGLFALLYWGFMPIGSIISGAVAQATSGLTAMFVIGAALGVATLLALLVRPQIVSLKVLRDGVSLAGDLRGTGVEAETPRS